MDEFESKHMEELQALGVKKWFQYVDDVFATVEDEGKIRGIIDFLNSKLVKHFGDQYGTEQEHVILVRNNIHREYFIKGFETTSFRACGPPGFGLGEIASSWWHVKNRNLTLQTIVDLYRSL